MTETIGWGDVDVDVAPPGRRRLRAVVVWATLLVVVGGVALAPTARARLASSAAASVAHVWAVARAYDNARITIEDRALARAAPGDRSRYVQVVSLTDREEASRLSRLAREVAAQHTWASDVHAAAVAVRRALDAEARDLDADAGRAATTFSADLYLATPTQAATQALQASAQRDIDRLTRRHRLRVRVKPAEVRLTAATSALAVLDRLTWSPVNVRLAVSHDGTLDVWDLGTGKGHKDVAEAPENPGFAQPLVRLGAGALFATDDGLQLVNPNGTHRRTALPADAEYFPVGDGSVWSLVVGHWKRYDQSRKPTGPTYINPAGYIDGAIAATAHSLVISQDSPYAGTRSALWNPATGSLTPLPGSCDAAITGSTHAIGYVSCDQRAVSVLDVRTGRVRSVHAPAGTAVDEVGMALSPDGSRLAFRASPLDGDDTNGALLLFDARTGRLTVIAHGATPLSWSADGTTLLMSNDVGENLYSIPLAYWADGMDQPEPIRIPLTGQPVSAVLLP